MGIQCALRWLFMAALSPYKGPTTHGFLLFGSVGPGGFRSVTFG